MQASFFKHLKVIFFLGGLLGEGRGRATGGGGGGRGLSERLYW